MDILLFVGLIAIVLNVVFRKWITAKTWVTGALATVIPIGAFVYFFVRKHYADRYLDVGLEFRSPDSYPTVRRRVMHYNEETAEHLEYMLIATIVVLVVWVICVLIDRRNRHWGPDSLTRDG